QNPATATAHAATAPSTGTASSDIAPAAETTAEREAGEARFQQLESQLKAAARKVPGRAVAFWVEDRLHNRTFAFHGDRVFRSASLIKIPVAALAYEQWERRPRRKTPEIAHRVWRIIAESHNPSTDVVVDHVGGLAQVNAFCRRQGWTHTRMNHKMMAWRTRKAHNVTTARDMAAMLRAIDDRTLVSAQASESLWKTLQDQKIVDRIPAGLPTVPGLRVGNKTGTMLAVVHDVGIVRGAGTRYLLVILIERPVQENPADAYCRRVSRLVYEALRPRR
ncbi:MAG TPA: serine hydrolase, partial [Armatimonadota bacterium]|nr:serine hydrolase [Armatimonadota bacterium]